MDALSLLKADHRTVEGLFKKYEKAGDRAFKTKRKLADQIIRELSIHASIEEEVFYPSVRKSVPAAEDVVLEGLEEHHIVKWTLSELEDLDPEAERFEPKMKVLIESVRHHVEEEEQEMFPQVRSALGRKRLADIGEELARAKKVVPSKPRPQAPDTPPGNLISGSMASVVESARDLGVVALTGKSSPRKRK